METITPPQENAKKESQHRMKPQLFLFLFGVVVVVLAIVLFAGTDRTSVDEREELLLHLEALDARIEEEGRMSEEELSAVLDALPVERSELTEEEQMALLLELEQRRN